MPVPVNDNQRAARCFLGLARGHYFGQTKDVNICKPGQIFIYLFFYQYKGKPERVGERLNQINTHTKKEKKRKIMAAKQ